MKIKVKGLKFRVPIVVEPDDPGYHSYCPALKGLHMGGDTEEEALANARDAAIAFLESMIEDGDPIPLDIMEPEKRKSSPLLKNKKNYHLEEIQVNC